MLLEFESNTKAVTLNLPQLCTRVHFHVCCPRTLSENSSNAPQIPQEWIEEVSQIGQTI